MFWSCQVNEMPGTAVNLMMLKGSQISYTPGLPRSWKSHEISGILKFSGISGKVMEFCLKLMKVMEFCDTVMEKSWKSHGKVMEFCCDNFVATLYPSICTNCVYPIG